MKRPAPAFFACHAGLGRQLAFALPSAIFLMVILAALAAFLVTVSTHQQSGHAADIQGVRAYQAARAGMEWGTFTFLQGGTNCAWSPASFNPGGQLAAFTVTVTCVSGTFNEAGQTITTAQIVATACNQPNAAPAAACPNNAPGANYVERQISVTLVP